MKSFEQHNFVWSCVWIYEEKLNNGVNLLLFLSGLLAVPHTVTDTQTLSVRSLSLLSHVTTSGSKSDVKRKQQNSKISSGCDAISSYWIHRQWFIFYKLLKYLCPGHWEPRDCIVYVFKCLA